MKLAVSNLAWDATETEAIRALFADTNVKGIEIAPTKVWQTPLEASEDQVTQFHSDWGNHGVNIVALQSVLFNQSQLGIFKEEHVRNELTTYMKGVVHLASRVKAHAIVFGSPKNRAVGQLEPTRAHNIAAVFFRDIGDTAEKHGVDICIEPNPAVYNCDFLTTFNETIDFVKEVNHPAIKINVDTGAMLLNREDPARVLEGCLSYIGHVHISEPFLQLVGGTSESRAHHEKVADTLESIGYDGWISIEMKDGLLRSNVAAVRRAVRFVLDTYPVA